LLLLTVKTRLASLALTGLLLLLLL